MACKRFFAVLMLTIFLQTTTSYAHEKRQNYSNGSKASSQPLESSRKVKRDVSTPESFGNIIINGINYEIHVSANFYLNFEIRNNNVTIRHTKNVQIHQKNSTQQFVSNNSNVPSELINTNTPNNLNSNGGPSSQVQTDLNMQNSVSNLHKNVLPRFFFNKKNNYDVPNTVNNVNSIPYADQNNVNRPNGLSQFKNSPSNYVMQALSHPGFISGPPVYANYATNFATPVNSGYYGNFPGSKIIINNSQNGLTTNVSVITQNGQGSNVSGYVSGTGNAHYSINLNNKDVSVGIRS